MNSLRKTFLAGAVVALAALPFASSSALAETERGRVVAGTSLIMANYSAGLNHVALISLLAGDAGWEGDVELNRSGELKYYTSLAGVVRAHYFFCGDTDDEIQDVGDVRVTFSAENVFRITCN
jgi:hypothetical protein